jgi:hypothetical protein
MFALNLQAIGAALQNLATQLRNTTDPMKKVMLVVDYIMACFTPP